MVAKTMKRSHFESVFFFCHLERDLFNTSAVFSIVSACRAVPQIIDYQCACFRNREFVRRNSGGSSPKRERDLVIRYLVADRSS